MAKKKTSAKSKSKAKAKPEAVKAAEVMKMPPDATVRSVAKDITSTKNEVGGLNSELADVIAAAKKDKGVHPGALKRVVGLLNKAKKTDRGLAAVATEMAHFDYYCDVLGLSDMLEQQGQMFARVEAGGKTPSNEQTNLEDAIKAAKPGPALAPRETEETAGSAPVH